MKVKVQGYIFVVMLVILFAAVSCSGKDTVKGKYEFSETTYDHILSEMLKEYGVEKGSAEYETSMTLIKESYPFDTLKQSYGGKDFIFEFDGKGTLSSTVAGITVPVTKYKVESDGKIYGEDKTYYGYVKDSIFWCAWYGTDDLLIPFTPTK